VSTRVSEAYLRIGELGRRAGVNPETIRAWERRYGLLEPRRTRGGFRLYTDEDVRRVRAMRDHLAAGLAAAEAARLVVDTWSSASRREAPAIMAGDLRAETSVLATALSRFDSAGANESLDRLLATYSLDTVLDEVIVPYLSELGERWEQGEASVGEEHYASHLLRGRLLGLARGWGQGGGSRAVLACAPGEQHDLGLLCFGLALRDRGWRIDYLGADTPVGSVAKLADQIEPSAIVIAAEIEGRLEEVADDLAALAAERALAIGGRATSPELADRIGAIFLEGPPARAADRLIAEI
jgi:DNA-binding transcriptional MerR regulator/methylmalonyl-CoA mutase cobalamin-binding subunit